MDNPSFICDNFICAKVIDAEEKLLLVNLINFEPHPVCYLSSLQQKKLNEAFATKNLEKFKMLLMRPIRKSLSKLNHHHASEDSVKESPNGFLRFNLFRNISIRMQSEIEVANSNYQQKFPYNDLLSQKILCYRKTSEDLSLLEKIMREPESADYIEFVWNECDFWRDAASLTTVI